MAKKIESKFTNKQINAIELMASGAYTHKKVAEAIGVSPETISHWKQNYLFTDAIIKRSREMLKESLPELYKIGLLKARDGSFGHFSTLLEHIIELEKLSESSKHARLTFTWETDADTAEIQTTPLPSEVPPGQETI